MLRPMPRTPGKASVFSTPPRLVRLAVLTAVVAVPLLASGRAHAGVTIIMQRGNEPTSTLILDNDKMRMENPKSNSERTVIIDAANKKMTMVNDADKSYMEVTQADLERFAAFMTQMRAQNAERMKSMPPEQRKKMEAMMGAAKTPDIKFEKMGGKKTINGFSCEMYRKLEDGKPTEEDCIAPWSASLIQKSDFAGLRKFAEDVAKTAGMMGGNNTFAQFDKSPGFPVSRHPLDATDHEDETLKSIKRGSISASTFAVPPGYTKKELPMGMMGGGGGMHHGPGGRPMAPPPGP
jgi:hypothetical protein